LLNTGYEDVIGNQALGKRKDNGDRLISFCSSIAPTVSKLEAVCSIIKIYTRELNWRSPDGKTVNQIDHICISRRWISSLQDVRVYRGADMASDHYMVVGQLKIKLKTTSRRKTFSTHVSYNVAHLSDEEVQAKYELELYNRFQLLQQDSDDIEEVWLTFKDTVNSTAESILGKRRGKRREIWLSNST